MHHFALIDARLLEDAQLLRRQVEPLSLKAASVVAPGQAYGTVLRRPEGDWWMYYLHGRDDRTGPRKLDRFRYRECLAVSDDGLRWTLPRLGLVDEEGSRGPHVAADADRANNVVMGIEYHDGLGNDLTGLSGPEGFCVLDAQQHDLPHVRGRYTALFLASPGDRVGGISLAHSDDGLTWTGYPENPIIPGWHDTAACFYFDPRPSVRRYVLYTRPPVYAGPHGANRKIARAESTDLVEWSEPCVALDTDEFDAPGTEVFNEGSGGTVRGRNRQWYGITAFPRHDLTLGLGWLYDVPSGRIVVELVHSYDGVEWRREPRREPLIDDGRPNGLAGSMFITSSNPPIAVGEEEWVYCSSTRRNHHAPREPGQPPDCDIHVLAQRRDRWIGYAADEREGALLTRPMAWRGGRLALNARIERDGEVRVSLHDAAGEPLRSLHLDEFVALRGPMDGVSLPVLAGPGPKSVLKLPTRGPVRLRVALRRATLFGWSWS